MNLKRTLASAVIACVAFTGVGVASASAGASAKTSPYATVTSPACKRESSKSCVWDAQKRGNKKGTSFYAMPKNSKGVYFVKGKRHVVKLPNNVIVYDVNLKSKKDGYVRRSTIGKGWVVVCPKTWTLERLNDRAFACN